jgi:predicted CXXCH cytochrome family protein
VGYRAGLNLQDFWRLEDNKLGEFSFTHFPDGTAHKNRMQGNDFVQSVMYRHGVTCFHCHDVHGTENYAQLRGPVDKLCLDCHGPMSLNGPRTGTLEEHTHHKAGSTGSQCVACHMPKIETTIADVKVRAHTFAFIYPSMTNIKSRIPAPHATPTSLRLGLRKRCAAGRSVLLGGRSKARLPVRTFLGCGLPGKASGGILTGDPEGETEIFLEMGRNGAARRGGRPYKERDCG